MFEPQADHNLTHHRHPETKSPGVRTEYAGVDPDELFTQALISSIGVPTRYARVKDILPQQERFLSPIGKWVANGGNLLIWGSTGSGKSCLAALALRAMCVRLNIRPGYSCGDVVRPAEAAWFSAPAVLADFRFDRGPLASARGVRLAVIDDVRETSSSQAGLMYVLVEERYSRELPTIYTTNLSPAQLSEGIDDRVASRLVSGVVVNLSGDDLRLSNAG
jgi:DNA replication protein DnaC